MIAENRGYGAMLNLYTREGSVVAYCFRNLIFEGGGVKGIGYVGAMQILQEKGIMDSITRAGGASAGAIVATLVGLNYSHNEISDILNGLDFRNFLDDSWGLVNDINRLIVNYGWYKGDFFLNWIETLIQQKTGITRTTFADVKNLQDRFGFKDIYIIGTNLSTRFSEVFSYEKTPQMCLADAVRISMSIPLFFTAPQNSQGEYYTDGGVLDNYPIRLFDRQSYVDNDYIIPNYYKMCNLRMDGNGPENNRYVYNKQTLGFRLDSQSEIGVFKDKADPPRCKINNFFDFTWGLVETVLECQSNEHLNSYDWPRTIYIDTLGVRTLDFGIDNEKRHALIQSGRECTEKYFVWYDDAENLPINHPASKKSAIT